MKFKSVVAKNFSRAANTYDQQAVLQQEIGHRLVDRLALIKISPAVILDLGCGTRFFSRDLADLYPNAHLINLDIAEGMILYSDPTRVNPSQSLIQADGDYLPFKSQSIDFVFSNCVLNWFTDPKNVLEEIYRVLKPEGLFLFSTFGPDTLKELRNSFAKVDPNPHVNTFMDMHDLGDLLLKVNFSDPVVDMETLTLTYSSLTGLLTDLKQTGSHTVNTSIPRGLNRKPLLNALEAAYERYRTEDHRLPATFEIIYGHAFVPSQKNLYRADEEGIVRIPLEHLMLRR